MFQIFSSKILHSLLRSDPDIAASIDWPFARVQQEVELAYGFALAADALAQAVPVLNGLANLYSLGVRSEVWSNSELGVLGVRTEFCLTV